MDKTKKRYDWLDIAKGIGIVLVVIGHNTPLGDGTYLDLNRFIFLFHVPLFFIISGYVMTPGDVKTYAIKRAVSLLVPYATYLVLIGLPYAYAHQNAAGRPFLLEFALYLYGGAHLVSFMGVFWFVTGLYFAQLVFKYALNAWKSVLDFRFIGLSLGLYVLAYIIAWKVKFPTPLALGIVPMAFVFLWLGAVFKAVEAHTKLLLAGSIAVFLGLLPIYGSFALFHVEMKRAEYGPFGAGLAAAVSLSLLLLFVSKGISKSPYPRRILASLGKASLTIMFLSQAVAIILKAYDVNAYLAVLLAVLIPYALHKLFERHRLTALLFLGQPLKTLSVSR